MTSPKRTYPAQYKLIVTDDMLRKAYEATTRLNFEAPNLDNAERMAALIYATFKNDPSVDLVFDSFKISASVKKMRLIID